MKKNCRTWAGQKNSAPPLKINYKNMPREGEPTPEEIRKLNKERTMSDANLLREGGEYTETGRLEVEEREIDRTGQEMNAELLARDLLKNFSEYQVRLMTEAMRRFSQDPQAKRDFLNTPDAQKEAEETAKRLVEAFRSIQRNQQV